MKIGKLNLSWGDYIPPKPPDLSNIHEIYKEKQKSGKILILGTLASRAGTRWLCDIFNAHENATGVTERYFVPESFWRYIKYNKLPIDTEGLVRLVKHGIVEDWNNADVSLVFSPYFSHGIRELYEELKPEKIIFAINDPKFTVQSIHNKDFFVENYFRKNVEFAIGYQPEIVGKIVKHFGRVVPNGEFYSEWVKLTRIGKIAWFGNRMNMDIYEQLKMVSSEKFLFVLNEADQNYEYYLNLVKVFDLYPILTKKDFLAIKKISVKKLDNIEHVWLDNEKKEFAFHTKEWQSLYKRIRTGNKIFD